MYMQVPSEARKRHPIPWKKREGERKGGRERKRELVTSDSMSAGSQTQVPWKIKKQSPLWAPLHPSPLFWKYLS